MTRNRSVPGLAGLEAPAMKRIQGGSNWRLFKGLALQVVLISSDSEMPRLESILRKQIISRSTIDGEQMVRFGGFGNLSRNAAILLDKFLTIP